MLLIIAHLLKTGAIESAVMVVTRSVLVEQIQVEAHKFPQFTDGAFSVTTGSGLDFSMLKQPKTAVLVDEADMVLEHKLIIIDPMTGKYNGLVVLGGHPMFMLTATLSDTWLTVLRRVFGDKDLAFHPFDTTSTVATGIQQVNNVETKTFGNAEACVNYMAEMARYMSARKPVIVFPNPFSKQVIDKMTKVGTPQGITYEIINSDVKAAQVRGNGLDLRQGVFLVDPRFGVGYDLKLGADAHVVIVDTERKLSARLCE